MTIRAHRWGLTVVEQVPELEPYKALVESLNEDLSITLTGLSVDLEKVQSDPNLTHRGKDAKTALLVQEALARIATVEARKCEAISTWTSSADDAIAKALRPSGDAGEMARRMEEIREDIRLALRKSGDDDAERKAVLLNTDGDVLQGSSVYEGLSTDIESAGAEDKRILLGAIEGGSLVFRRLLGGPDAIASIRVRVAAQVAPGETARRELLGRAERLVRGNAATAAAQAQKVSGVRLPRPGKDPVGAAAGNAR